MNKASIMREKCCGMVLHGGRPDPVEVVDALAELEAERDAAYAAGFEACREMAMSIAHCEFIKTEEVRILSALSPQPPVTPEQAARVLLREFEEDTFGAIETAMCSAYDASVTGDIGQVNDVIEAFLRAPAGGKDHE